MKHGALVLIVATFVLAGCGADGTGQGGAAPAADLETIAIERGVIPDPEQLTLAGTYARDGDRMCIVGQGGRYRVGAYSDYGEALLCSASGTATRSGEVLRISFGDAGCAFDARIAGEEIVLPGALPQACERLCDTPASLAGLQVARISDSEVEARSLRDPRGRALCPAD